MLILAEFVLMPSEFLLIFLLKTFLLMDVALVVIDAVFTAIELLLVLMLKTFLLTDELLSAIDLLLLLMLCKLCDSADRWLEEELDLRDWTFLSSMSL